GYVWRVNRVFGNRAPQRDFTARSHLLQMQWHGWKAGTVTAYALRLDLRNSAANSSETVGASLAGGAPVTDAFKLTYRLEAARQSDAANNPRRYTAPYWRAELGGVSGPGSFSAGWEQLGSDGGRQ